jgi:predicted oxidoreductase
VWSLQGSPLGRDAATPAKPDWIVEAATIEELAGRIGVDADNLVATVERFNRQVAAGGDRDFGRGSYAYDRFCQGVVPPRGVTEPPFYGLRVLPGSLGTKGGLKTDADGRVMHTSGGPIPGLYAAGNAAASPFGAAYPGPGATIGPALYFGWRAGLSAAAA